MPGKLRSVPSTKPQIALVVDPAFLERIDRFWHRHAFMSRAKALRYLVEWALALDEANSASDFRPQRPAGRD